MKALVIPETGPLVEIEIPSTDGLRLLQETVGGNIEAVPVPGFIPGADAATAYVNEDGKVRCGPNIAGDRLHGPRGGIMWGDYVSGPMILAGFDAETGAHAPLPYAVVTRARTIEREAS